MKTDSGVGAIFHAVIALVFLLLPAAVLAEPITLRQTVELALKHAPGAAMAADDVQHAAAAYRELHNSYIPHRTVGAGLGWSYGYPLSLEGPAPSLFNVTAQSALLHPELRPFLRAAQMEGAAAASRSNDQRNQIIQDTVLTYAELEKWEQRLARL